MLPDRSASQPRKTPQAKAVSPWARSRCSSPNSSAGPKIAAALPDSIPTADCGMEFERAIQTACEHARPGDTVLLAPACASMDLFRDYKERGDRFAAFVKQL